jgi:hypothetical protein
VYHNSTQAGSDSPTDPSFNDESYVIGGFNGEHMDGQIADLRVYNRPITEDEINALYQMRTQRHVNL